MWIDYKSLSSEYEIYFLAAVAKALVLCQKIERSIAIQTGLLKHIKKSSKFTSMDELNDMLENHIKRQ